MILQLRFKGHGLWVAAIAIVGAMVAPLSSLAAEPDPRAESQAFFENNCFDCHTGEAAEAGLNLAEIEDPTEDAAAFEQWVRLYDRVAAGEMPPPKDYGRLDDEVSQEFLDRTGKWLRSHQLTRQQTEGRVPARRLTHRQLERSLQDLLAIDIPLATEIPEEPRHDIYDTLAEHQTISHFDVENYLKVVDLALDEAFRRADSDSDTWDREMSAQKISRTRTRCREPELIDEGAVVWSSRLSFYGRVPATTAKESGWYRFRFQVSSLKKPENKGVWCTVRSGQCVSSAPLMTTITTFEADEEAALVEFETWLPKGHMLEIRPADTTLKMARFAGGQAENGEGGKQDVPGIRIDWLNMSRIHRNWDDNQVRENLHLDRFEQAIRRAKTDTETDGEAEDKGAENGDAERRPTERDVDSSDVETIRGAGHQAIADFANQAFRRPTNDEVLDDYWQIFDDMLEQEQSPEMALRAAYRAMLCSPRFLYFHEQPGELDAYAVANRLSYMLWNSMPDQRLFDLASTGELLDREVLRAEISRLLDEAPRGDSFVADFVAQWLDLRELEVTEPNRKLHPKFDTIVQSAMREETERYIQHLVDEDLSVRHLIDSDFTFLNGRLASYYGIDGVNGDDFQRVELGTDSVRGGLLGQGAILKVTANGADTSPVIRGTWVAERILGNKIPPPPESVPAVEPDTRGATTIREQLAKHRDSSQCASCHTKIDPPGFALENFDATGQWRQRYPKNGKPRKGPKIDPSYTTPEGESFDDVTAFRSIYSKRSEQLSAGFVGQLVSYGTGMEPTFADRPEIDRIVERAAEGGYGVRTLLEETVLSELFLAK